MFWSKWPPTRRGSKGKALTSWEKLCGSKNKHRPTRWQIWSAIREQKKSAQWQDEKFIPLAATWLNNKRWLDDVKELKKYNFEGSDEHESFEEKERAKNSFEDKFGK
ncbi:hypothetical protein LCGC14_1597830 [marine sediment metagenome]|uniref:Uncharacterized protein n=1 Tax=marine sediment metagenome TaxID=412755 RepID=A0A0F9ICG3_9ZZZZ